jgi:integrase
MVTIRPYKRGGWEYDLRIKLPDGTPYQERRKAPGKTKADAVEYARQREAHLIRHGLSEKAAREAPRIPLLRDFALPTWLERYAGERGLKPSTLSRYASLLDAHILPALGYLALDRVDSGAASELAALMGAKDYSLTHRRGAQAVLGKLLRCAVRWEVIPEYPIKHAPEIPVPRGTERWYSDRECERLVEAAEKHAQNTLLVVLLGVDAGLRPGEMLALEWADLDLEEARVTVRRQDWHGHTGTPKGGKPRTLKLTPRLTQALKAAKHLRARRVIVDDAGRSTTANTMRLWLKSAERLAGLPEKGEIRILRHTFCSRLAAAGAPARSIQALAGHASLLTTQTYMHLSPLEADRSIDLLGGGDEKETGRGRTKKTSK